MPNLNETLTLQNVVDFASTHVELMPLSGVGGVMSEPALSLCNDVLSELLAQPNNWKFNSVAMPPFVTAAYRQDYTFGGAVAFTQAAGGAGIALKTAGTPGVSRTGTTVTVTTLEPHNFTVGDTVFMLGNVDAPFNSAYLPTPTGSSYTGGWVITSAPTTTSFVFTHATSGTTTSGAPGILDYGWLETLSMRALNSTSPLPQVWHPEVVNFVPPTSYAAQPTKLCVIDDNGDGTLHLRFDYAGSNTFFVVNAYYQAQAPLRTALSQTWAPFPDAVSFVIRQCFLARAYRFINSPLAAIEYAKSEQAIQKAIGRDNNEPSDQRLYPEQSLMSMSDGCYYDDY
jgi:hypothetical protein